MTPAGDGVGITPAVDNGGPQAHGVGNDCRPTEAVYDMVGTFHNQDDTNSEPVRQGANTNILLDSSQDGAQSGWMLSAAQLLKLLEERNIPQRAIADALGVAPPRVSELYAGRRRLQLDEAKRLVERFGIPEHPAPPVISQLSLPVARLLVLHAAQSLGLEIRPEDMRIEELAKDFRAFSAFAADHRARENADVALGFLQGMAARRDVTGE